jgi:hypothetical protein
LLITPPIVSEPLSKALSWEHFCLFKAFLREKGLVQLKISGVSMLPLLKDEEVIEVHPLSDLSVLKKFDVIVFWQENLLICHYFWRKNSYFYTDDNHIFLTRPLNPLNAYDIPIKDEQILGVVKNVKMNCWLKLRTIMTRDRRI